MGCFRQILPLAAILPFCGLELSAQPTRRRFSRPSWTVPHVMATRTMRLPRWRSTDRPARVTTAWAPTNPHDRGSISAPVACTECHPVPTLMNGDAHPDPLARGTVTQFLGPLAQTGGATPTWNRTKETCTNTYCHGATLPGTFKTSGSALDKGRRLANQVQFVPRRPCRRIWAVRTRCIPHTPATPAHPLVTSADFDHHSPRPSRRR